jgi:hypothetical protein
MGRAHGCEAVAGGTSSAWSEWGRASFPRRPAGAGHRPHPGSAPPPAAVR